MRNHRLSKITIFTLLFFICSLIFPDMAGVVYALDGSLNPNVEIYIHGEKTNGGAIFNTAGEMGRGLWSPGASETGIIRVYNNYSNIVSIRNLGIRMKLYNTITDKEVSDAGLIEEFAKAMKLTIKKGSFMVFKNTVFDGNFLNMLYSKDSANQKGFELGIPDRINIARDTSVDLEYKVSMDKSAGNNLQGLKATVDFIINSQENPYGEPPDNKDDDRDRGDNHGGERADTIPDIGGHWAHDCILALIEHGVLEPDSNGSVRPEDYITRAETAVLMAKALKLEESNAISTGYVDAMPTWARGYIISVTKAKVFKGYPGRVFKAFANISREEVTAVFIRAFRDNSESRIKMGFTDSDKIANWARGNVAASVEQEIVTGYAVDNTFRPKEYMKRAEAFTIICKLLGYHEEHNKKVSSIHQP